MEMTEIGQSIWRIESGAPGPAVALLGGTHGNERTGVDVIRKLHAAFSSGEHTLATGVLYLVLGNLEAIALNQRSTGHKGGGTGDGNDLNRMFERARLDREPDGTYEDRRAREIASLVLDHVDISIDVHSVNKPSVPFLPCATSPRHEKVYRWFQTDFVVDDPSFFLGGRPVTTDEYVNTRGGVGICFETGFSSDTSRASEVLESVYTILRDQGMLNDREVDAVPNAKVEYIITDKIVIDDRGFVFTDGMGKGSFQEFHAGESIGMQGNDPYIAAYDGVLIFPEREEMFAPGVVATWIAKRKNA